MNCVNEASRINNPLLKAKVKILLLEQSVSCLFINFFFTLFRSAFLAAKNRSIKKNFNVIGCKNLAQVFGYAFLAAKNWGMKLIIHALAQKKNLAQVF